MMAFKKDLVSKDNRTDVQFSLLLKSIMLIVTKLDQLTDEVRDLSATIKTSLPQEEVH